jgi:hypothetical protein
MDDGGGGGIVEGRYKRRMNETITHPAIRLKHLEFNVFSFSAPCL